MKIDATLRIFYLQFFISLAPAPCSMARTPTSRQKTGEPRGLAFVGCYELRLGRWWPWSFGGDTIFVTPPRRIRLLPSRGTNGFEEDQFLIRAIPDTKASIPARGGASFWQPKSDEQVDLVWTDGFTGVTLSLEEQGNELHGWAHPHFDAPHFIPRIERVKARKIACPLSN
jgi:hypothetical protein